MRTPFRKVFISALELTFPCFAQQVKIRVLNQDSGQALANQTVTVQFLNDSPASVSPPITLQTDSNGETEIALPNPMPQHLDVRVTLASEHWHCGCWVMTDTRKVLQDGVTDMVTAKNRKTSEKSDPGVITIAAVPFTFWEKLLYPLVKR